MIRRDIIEKAGNRPNILFPIFTNGTLLDDTYIRMLKKCRNLLPIFSIEGKEKQTDARRGEGVYEKVLSTMEQMQKEKLLFGSSVTVTKENLEELHSELFMKLHDSGTLMEEHVGGCLICNCGVGYACYTR